MPWKRSSFLLPLLLVGCATSPQPAAKLDASESYLRHPEFKAAAQAAPNLMSDMLTQITRYEARIEKLENR